MRLSTGFLAALSLACSFGNASVAQVKLRPTPNVMWPFGEYRVCFGNSAINNVAKKFVEDDQSRMAEAGQSRDKQYLVDNWSVAITNEQIIAAHEYTLEQCVLRKAGEVFDDECPLEKMSRRDAMEAVGADSSVFWSLPSSHLSDVKVEQKHRLNSMSSALLEACGS